MHTKNNLNNKNQTASPAGDQSADVKGKTQLLTPMSQAILAAHTLARFITPAELEVIGNAVRGEEGEFWKSKLVELADIVDNMPVVYETDGQGDAAVVWLHYFSRDCDWYITERDQEEELGYISIQELIKAGVELDLYWTPKTIGEVKAERLLGNVNYVGSPIHY